MQDKNVFPMPIKLIVRHLIYNTAFKLKLKYATNILKYISIGFESNAFNVPRWRFGFNPQSFAAHFMT